MNLNSFTQKIQFIVKETTDLGSAMRLLYETIIQYLALKTNRYSTQISNRMFRIQLNGLSHELNLRNQDLAVLYETFLDKTYDYSYSIAKGGTIVDLGSHIGITATFFSIKYNLHY